MCLSVQEPFPSRPAGRARGLFTSISESMDDGPVSVREYFRKPFEFLSLGLLAYVGVLARAHRGLK